MNLSDAVRRVAACAPGKVVRVAVSGESCELPLAPAQSCAKEPNPLDQIASRLIQNEKLAGDRMDALASDVHAVRSVVNAVVDGQIAVVEGINRVVTTLAMPVHPIYDAHGKLIGATRTPQQ